MTPSIEPGPGQPGPSLPGVAEPEAIEASVIIPSLDAAAHIEEQLSALAGQRTDVRWEVTVADNGSTDGTRAVLERWAPFPSGSWTGQARGGAPPHATPARRRLSASYCSSPTPDDVVDQMWVQRLVGALREHAFVGGEVDLLELNDPQTGAWYSPLVAAPGELPHLHGRPRISGCNFGLTCAAFAAVGGFDENALYAEDVELSFHMYEHGMPAVHARGALVHYRLRPRPMQVVRQHWSWGAGGAQVNERYEIPLPTLLDLLIVISRTTKQAIRESLRGRPPVRQAVTVAHALGEASVACRRPAFWRPVYRQQRPVNPLALQRDRFERLLRLIGA